MMFHNAGFSMRCIAMDMPWQNDESMLQCLMISPILISKLLLPQMKERKFGHIVVISSLAAVFLGPIRTTYGAAKAGVAAYHTGLFVCLFFAMIF